MKKSEKTERTKDKIIAAALSEFGTKGYATATLNDICKEYGISKGLLYHNFENKDALYLQCVSTALRTFMDEMSNHPIGSDLQQYMKLRYRFFSDQPLLGRIFFEAVLQPPAHLAGEIRELKREFDVFNLNIYRTALKEITLRPGVTEQEAMAYYSLLQEMFNGYFVNSMAPGTAFSDMVNGHEEMLAKLLDFMLYGIAKEDNT